MRSLWQESARQELLERLDRLSSDSRAVWGRMNAARMLAHLNDSFRMAFGELPARPRGKLLRMAPINYVAACCLPFGKGIRTPPELIRRPPEAWDVEMRALRDHLAAFGRRDPREPWAEHPFFGKLPGWAWGVLGYRHIDHHLRQFGL